MAKQPESAVPTQHVPTEGLISPERVQQMSPRGVDDDHASSTPTMSREVDGAAYARRPRRQVFGLRTRHVMCHLSTIASRAAGPVLLNAFVSVTAAGQLWIPTRFPLGSHRQSRLENRRR